MMGWRWACLRMWVLSLLLEDVLEMGWDGMGCGWVSGYWVGCHPKISSKYWEIKSNSCHSAVHQNLSNQPVIHPICPGNPTVCEKDDESVHENHPFQAQTRGVGNLRPSHLIADRPNSRTYDFVRVVSISSIYDPLSAKTLVPSQLIFTFNLRTPSGLGMLTDTD